MKKKIYISGRITGLKKNEYMANFEYAERYLKNKGYSVINPAKTNATLPADTTYEQYMDMSLCMLAMCDTIYMLSDWEDSKGAIRERSFAEEHDYEIMYEKEVLEKDVTRDFKLGSEWWFKEKDMVVPVIISNTQEDIYSGKTICARSQAKEGKYQHLAIMQKPEWFIGKLIEREDE